MMADLYRGIERFSSLGREEILAWLRTTDPAELEELFAAADTVRHRAVGDEVHLRGLVEISNHCRRRCAYCGIRAPNRALPRYRMTQEEILAAAREARAAGFGTLVLQAGEDPEISGPFIASCVRRVKQETPLAVTLSLGERSQEELLLWREAGADRYLLRFETSDMSLYRRIHPPFEPGAPARKDLLQKLRALGYEVGSGVMIGIPGQSYASLADDILAFRETDLDMIGVGPYLPHPQTPLGRRPNRLRLRGQEQVPNSADMTYRVLALSRLVCPFSNIPSTTALATLADERGRDLGLLRGANVVMPNLTPERYRSLYEIYPNKACLHETAEFLQNNFKNRIEALGRKLGAGPGGKKKQ